VETTLSALTEHGQNVGFRYAGFSMPQYPRQSRVISRMLFPVGTDSHMDKQTNVGQMLYAMHVGSHRSKFEICMILERSWYLEYISNRFVLQHCQKTAQFAWLLQSNSHMNSMKIQ